jgi:hypothetical protein
MQSLRTQVFLWEMFDFLSELTNTRSGDRECPLRVLGNLDIENERLNREDPMNLYVGAFDHELEEKYKRVERLKELLEEVREEERERKRRKQEKKERRKENKAKTEKWVVN